MNDYKKKNSNTNKGVIKSKNCLICKNINSNDSIFCTKCDWPLNPDSEEFTKRLASHITKAIMNGPELLKKSKRYLK
ncbi:MAG: hypothetical protein AB1571_02685 [Nanoarchaeota archaeon]